MSLKPCRECSHEVSTEADVCPHCGIHSPTVSNPIPIIDDKSKQEWWRRRTTLVLFWLALLVLIGLLLPKSPEEPKSEEEFVKQVQNAAKAVEEAACRSDWTKCADNAQFVNNNSDWWTIKKACKDAANKQVLYDTPIWPSSAFDHFQPSGNSYITTGKAIAIEPDAQFQNGFGTMVHSHVICTYDLRAKKVIYAFIFEGRLDSH